MNVSECPMRPNKPGDLRTGLASALALLPRSLPPARRCPPVVFLQLAACSGKAKGGGARLPVVMICLSLEPEPCPFAYCSRSGSLFSPAILTIRYAGNGRFDGLR